MFAKRSVPKDYSPTDTSDTETLLDKGESQEGERPLNSSPSVTSERNRGLRAYLHIAAIVFYSVITGLLYVWSVRINGSKCGCEDGMVYSPARTAVVYEKQTIVHNFGDNSKYKGPPRPEQDAAWEDLLRYYNLRVQQEDLEKAHVSSVPFSDDQGGFLVVLDVFHNLHCVDFIRKAYYSDYYHNPNPVEVQQEHFDHCVDLLRQDLMCHGDTSLHTFEWKDDYRWPWPVMQTEHQCRNWDKLVAWSMEHHVPNMTGPILTHPSLGPSFRGDEPS